LDNVLRGTLDYNSDIFATLVRSDNFDLSLSDGSERNGAFVFTVSVSVGKEFLNFNVILLEESEHTNFSAVTFGSVSGIIAHFDSSITVKDNAILDEFNHVFG
jgi:hypothetical protein